MNSALPSDTLLVDLHLHTTCSDGVWPRERLFDEIRARKLDVFCVSDHDTLDAYPMPDDLRERAIPGLEVDTHFDGHSTHLLAYGVDDVESPLMRELRRQRDARIERMLAMVERCNGLGLDVSMEHVYAQAGGASSLGRPHLARALVQLGYVATVQDAFDRYLADEGTGYVALDRLDAARAIDLIHRSGGICSVAHPKRLRAAHHLDELIALGADAVEVLHPTASEEDTRHFRTFAKQHGVLVTGGTDFHAPRDGSSIGVPFARTDIERLREAIAERTSSRV